jgi:serine/threonine protein kinase
MLRKAFGILGLGVISIGSGTDRMAVVAGQSFGNFQVVRLLGEGGFGEVYEAENPFLQRRAAIKVLHTGMVQEPELVRRFLNEARAASAIRHPNIIEVFDAGVTSSGEPYILMEFLEGDSLQKLLLQGGRMPLRTVQEIARQAGSALSAAHAAGIVHRDLKPENLFVIPDPGMPLGLRVKVLDFGIAKVKHRDDQVSTMKTQAGLLMGSPAYMSPEQCRDSSDVDLRSDIYSLAIIVYEMLAGVPPFACKSATEMLVLQIMADPPPLAPQVADLPDYVEQTVMRALSKNRDDRYASVDYFIGALHGTYPALTAQGNSAATRTLPGLVPDRAAGGFAAQPTPAPVVLRESRVGLTPAPLGVPGSTITTLSQATGETGRLLSSSAGEDTDWEVPRPRRWPWLVVPGVLAAVAVGFFALRPVPVPPAPVAPVAPAPNPTIVWSIRTDPVGATVVDVADGSVLGTTPLQKSFVKGSGSKTLVLRLPGYRDETLTVGLDESSANSLDLKPIAAAPAASPAKPSASPPQIRKKPAATARKAPHDEEDEWRVH